MRRRLQPSPEGWTKTRENLEAIGHQLATITELVQLVHQESLVPPDPVGVGETIDQFLADFEESAGAPREIAEMGVDESYELCEIAAEPGTLMRRSG